MGQSLIYLLMLIREQARTRPIKQVIQGSIPYQYVVGAPVQATAVLICAPSVDGTKRTNEHGVARGRESAEYG